MASYRIEWKQSAQKELKTLGKGVIPEFWKQLRSWLRTLILGVAESLWVLNIRTTFASVIIALCTVFTNPRWSLKLSE